MRLGHRRRWRPTSPRRPVPHCTLSAKPFTASPPLPRLWQAITRFEHRLFNESGLPFRYRMPETGMSAAELTAERRFTPALAAGILFPLGMKRRGASYLLQLDPLDASVLRAPAP